MSLKGSATGIQSQRPPIRSGVIAWVPIRLPVVAWGPLPITTVSPMTSTNYGLAWTEHYLPMESGSLTE